MLAAAPGASAAGAPSPMTGQLSRSGYRVIALAATGKATSVRVRGTTFSLRPPATRVTLHLRAPDGRCAGPIVVGRSGRRVVVGVRAGARLGRIRIRAGYSTLRTRLARRWLDTSRQARARNGVPLGAGKIGLVRVKLPPRGAPGDRDLDGIPDVVNIDDDGDLILDGYDRPARFRTSGSIAQTARATSFPDGSNLDLNTMFGWTPYGAVNADGGSTDEQLAAAQRSGGVLAVFWDGLDPGSGELDCGTLVYCSAGGTGLWRQTSQPPDPSDSRGGRPSFPECCDADGDGLGSLVSDQAGGMNGGMFLLHGATSDQIRADDVLIARGTENGAAVQYPASVGFVFSSVPVFAGYDDGQGNASSFSYPPSEACRPASVFAGVTGQCSSPVRAGADGEVVLRLTVWRPQRPRLETEPGTAKWMDVGHLAYATFVQTATGGGGWCPQSSYTATDANLSPLAFSLNGIVPAGAAFADVAADQPADPASVLSFTLNLSQCSAAIGAPPGKPAPLVQIWSYAIGSNYPTSGPAPDAHSQVGFRLVP